VTMFPRPRARRDEPMTLFCVALDDEDMYLLSSSAADFRARGVPVSYLRRFEHVLPRYDELIPFKSSIIWLNVRVQNVHYLAQPRRCSPPKRSANQGRATRPLSRQIHLDGAQDFHQFWVLSHPIGRLPVLTVQRFGLIETGEETPGEVYEI
jgi:hypothetical protein